MESLRPLTEEIRINCVMFVVGDVQLSEALCSYNSSKDLYLLWSQRGKRHGDENGALRFSTEETSD